METVFDKIQDYANMAEAYGVAKSKVQLIKMGLIIIMNAVIYADDVGVCHALNPFAKTWEAFQNHFILAPTTYKANRPTEISASPVYTTPGPQANTVVMSQPEQELAAANEYIAKLEADQAVTHQSNLVSLTTFPSSSTDDTIKQLLQKMNDLEAEVKGAKINNGTGTKNSNKNKGK